MLIAFCFALACPVVAQQAGDGTTPEPNSGWQYIVLDAVRMQVPADWVVLDERSTSETVADMQREFEMLKDVDMSMIQAMAISPVEDAFSENVNISPTPGVAKINAEELQGYLDGVMQQLNSVGYESEILSSRIDTIAGVECYALDIHSRFEGFEIYQLQYVVPGVDATYMITYSCGMSDRAWLEPLFEESIKTLRITGREYNPIERSMPVLSSMAKNAMLYGVLGAAGGLAIALIVLGLKRD